MGITRTGFLNLKTSHLLNPGVIKSEWQGRAELPLCSGDSDIADDRSDSVHAEPCPTSRQTGRFALPAERPLSGDLQCSDDHSPCLGSAVRCTSPKR